MQFDFSTPPTHLGNTGMRRLFACASERKRAPFFARDREKLKNVPNFFSKNTEILHNIPNFFKSGRFKIKIFHNYCIYNKYMIK